MQVSALQSCKTSGVTGHDAATGKKNTQHKSILMLGTISAWFVLSDLYWATTHFFGFKSIRNQERCVLTIPQKKRAMLEYLIKAGVMGIWIHGLVERW